MSSLCVFRTHRNKKYSTINLNCVEDNKLSWESKGLHTYLISRPNGWKVHLSELLKRSTNGRHSLRSCLRELNEFGYIEWTQILDDKRKFLEMKYDVYEKSNQDVIERNMQKKSPKSDTSDEKTNPNPQTGFPQAGNPYYGKPASGKSVGGKSAPNNNHNNINQKPNNNQGSNNAPSENYAPNRYSAEWQMWKAEQGEQIFVTAFGEKPIFTGKDWNAFCVLRDHGKMLDDITKRYEIFCNMPNEWYQRNGYAFHVFAENFVAIGNINMQRIKEKTSTDRTLEVYESAMRAAKIADSMVTDA